MVTATRAQAVFSVRVAAELQLARSKREIDGTARGFVRNCSAVPRLRADPPTQPTQNGAGNACDHEVVTAISSRLKA